MTSEPPEAKALDEPPYKLSAEHLSQEHRDVLSRAIRNVLSTSSAEVAYAQIIDGAPLSETYKDVYGPVYPLKHPVKTEHLRLCPGVLEKTRQIRDSFDLNELKFETKVGDRLLPLIYLALDEPLIRYSYSSSTTITLPRQAQGPSKPAWLRWLLFQSIK